MTETKEIALVLTGTLPQITDNIEARKAFYAAEMARYDAVVTADGVQSAKNDLATLRAEIKRIDRIRIDEVSRLTAPIKNMEKQVKELTGIIEKTIEKVSGQVKKFEDETRKLCGELMTAYLAEKYDGLEVREEFRTGYPTIETLIHLTSVTTKGALTKAARESIEGLAQNGRNAQLQHDGRLEKLKSRCLEAGLESPLQPEFVEAFIHESDAIYDAKLDRLINTSLENQKKAAAAAIARETARIQAEEKAKAEAAAAETARLAKQKADDEARAAKIEKEKQDKIDREAQEKKAAAEKKPEPEKRAIEPPVIPPKAESPKEQPKAPPCLSNERPPQNQERIPYWVLVKFEIRTFPDRTAKMVELVTAEMKKTSFADALRSVTFSIDKLEAKE